MRILARKRLAELGIQNAAARGWLARWYQVTGAGRWESLRDVRKTFPHADAVAVKSANSVTVFNACGNKYRLVVAIHYNVQRVFVLRFMTHADYEKGSWKQTL